MRTCSTTSRCPRCPNEKELWQRIDKELTDVDVLAGQIMQATAGGRYLAAQRLLVEELPDAIDDEADAIMADIQLNAARVAQVADLIEGERKNRAFWVFGLDGVSVALAVALALLALKTMARNEAIVRRRSEELEGFAGRVAHDLLNPISAAEMSLAATERGAAGNERMVALAARGKRSLSRARALVDDLFAFAQAGARPVPGMTTSVAEVVEGVIEELRAPALERNITINVTPLVAPVAVRCANGVLASLISNLVRNAIKHMGGSARRQVDVRIEPRHDRVRFEVQDTGPGLPPELVSQRVRSICPRRRHVRTGPGPGPGDRAAAGRGPFRPLRRRRRGRARGRCSGSSCRRRIIRRPTSCRRSNRSTPAARARDGGRGQAIMRLPLRNTAESTAGGRTGT